MTAPLPPDEAPNPGRRRAPSATRRTRGVVMPLELFFDLVFVLALTQTTQIMASELSWLGVGQAMIVLTLMWWAWTGYVWLTTVVDPEAGAVRMAIAGAMVGMVICALCMPQIFTDRQVGLTFACAYGAVRAMHVVLLLTAAGLIGAEPDAPKLRRSVLQLSAPSAVAVVLVGLAVIATGPLAAVLWCAAVALDLAGALITDPAGWKLHPEHFAERHGLVIIIALGESIVAVGAGAAGHIEPGVVVAASASVAICFILWWLHFDVVALAATRRLAAAEVGREQNTLARDSYSYLHLYMVAGIVLMALGLKKALAHVGDPLHAVPAAALLGGVALYLLTHVAFRLRNVHSWNLHRATAGIICLAAIPLAMRVPALATVLGLTAAGAVLLVLELRRQGAARGRIRAMYAEGDGH